MKSQYRGCDPPPKTETYLEEGSIKMNKILILCLGILITLLCSTQQVSIENTTESVSDPSVASAAGLGPWWPTALCLLIPPILAFIQ
ncbi:hypothetical protein F2P79_000123 [Pimephales promelas]|nr:hypothetical protein F2P79_000123 [Pimephales promelas]